MAIEKSYIDMLKERDVKIEALKELLRLSHESLDSKDKQIAEPEKEKEKASHVPVLAWIARECNQVDGVMLHRFKSYLEILKLEQQAKGCDDGAKACSISFGGDAVVIGETELNDYANDLRNQAKALEEQE
jgi:hypothetical protein